MINKYLIPILIFVMLSCHQEKKDFDLDDEYRESHKNWQSKLRKGRNDYLRLAGLFKLQPFDNTFGSDATNEMVLKVSTFPDILGNISLVGDSIGFKSAQDIVVKNKQDSLISEIHLPLDDNGNSEVLFHKDISWRVITRSGEYYLRVWDENNPYLKTFSGFEWYPLNKNMIFTAKFRYYEKPEKEYVSTRLGTLAETVFVGEVSFTFQDEVYSLKVGELGFTMVTDQTSGERTYGGGRYMYLDLPTQDSSIMLDFNRLYNPPCAYSEFTTCLFPPEQNILPFAIEAGETVKIKN